MTGLLAAVAFLTRVPVKRSFEASAIGRAASFFPLVGAAIGLASFGAFLLLEPRLPPLVLAVALVALSAWMTRAIHLDGLSDFADGLGGGKGPEDSLRIMRDPRAGAFGVVTLVVVLAMKIAAVQALKTPTALVVGPALARWASVPLASFLPSARAGEGLGGTFASGSGRTELIFATLSAGVLSLLVDPGLALLLWGGVLSTTLVVGAIARKRLGGVTGDVLGANVELSETLALVLASC